MASLIQETILALRATTSHSSCVAQLCAVSKDASIDQTAFTDALLRATRVGSLSANASVFWASITRNTACILQCLRQSDSPKVCKVAISNLARGLRNDDLFDATWEAIGGTTGLVAILDTLSVQHVNYLCHQIAMNPRAVPVRQKRQQACKDLLAVLCPKNAEIMSKRPLQNAYHTLVLACDADTALDWDDHIRVRLRRSLREIHSDAFLSKSLDACFPSSTATRVRSADFVCLQALIQGNPLRYGLATLTRLAESEAIPAGLEADELVETLIWPLVRRKLRKDGKRIDRKASASLWKGVAACFEKHPVLRTYVKALKKNTWIEPSRSILLKAARDWGRFEGDADHEVSLAMLLQLVDKYVVRPSTDILEDSSLREDGHPLTDMLVRCVPPHLRYRLLRLFFQHANGFGLDMGALGDTPIALSEAQRLRFTLPTFFLLPPNEARLLAQRLLASDPDLEWLSNDKFNTNRGKTGLLTFRRSPSDHRPDPYIRQAMLQNTTGATGGLSLTEELSQRKKKSQTSREADGRAFWARSAVSLSIAMGNLETYKATLAWSSRFIKDWSVCNDLFSADIVHSAEGVDLLCVVPPKSLLAFSCFEESVFAAAVGEANQVLELYIQQALNATREPAFQYYNWRTVFTLINNVMFRRLQYVNAWQDRFHISDAQVTKFLLAPTLDALIDAERRVLAFMNEELCNIARDILCKQSSPSLGHLRPPALLFIDTLAKARDGLWEAYRVRLDPHVASLGAPWPRGLILKNTVLFTADAPFTLPYMEERAKSIVFGDIDLYLCPVDAVDDDTKKAVGRFVEDWPKALYIYVCGTQGEERERRIRSAWDYVAGSLSTKLGLSGRQIRDFWEPVFRNVGIDIPKPDDEIIMVLPSADFPLSSPTSAWNPMASPLLPAPVKECRMKRVCLGAVLRSCSLDNVQANLIPGISGLSLYWDLATSQKHLPQSVVDCYICTAVAVLNTQFGSAPLLDEPFPSSDPAAVRFPAMNLDQDFARATGNIGFAESALEAFVRPCPAALLTRLASSLLNTLLQLVDKKAGDHFNKCFSSFVFILKLVKKKAPVQARDLAIKAVLGMPLESSWHRILLNKGLLRQLPSTEAEKAMNELLEGLQQRSQAAELAAKDANAKEDDQKQAAPVKITTIKMVAQLLNDTVALSPESAVSILTRMFRVSTHIDVSREAVASLIRVAQSLPDDATAVQQQIVQALATYAVPRAGSLEEGRKQYEMTEHDWQSVDAGQTPLPEIRNDQHPFLILALIEGCQETRPASHPGHPQLYNALLRLLEAALRENGRLHRRWMQSFIIREKLAVWSEEIDSLLPAVPALPDNVNMIFKDAGLVTPDLFQAMSQHALQIIDPPAVLSAITTRIDASPKLRRSHEGRHWLDMWKKQGSYFRTRGGYWATSTLVSPTSTPDTLLDGASDVLANFVRDMAFAYLRVGDSNGLDALTAVLIHEERKKWDTERPSLHRGRGKGLALLHQLESETDRMRSQPSWRQNPDRQPASLPDSFAWKFKIWQCGVPSEGTEVSSDLVDGTVQLIQELVEDTGVPYHHGINALKDWFCTKITNGQSPLGLFLANLAIALGSVDATAHGAHGSLIRCLCADLSCSYLSSYKEKHRTAGSPWGEATPRVEAMLEVWKRSSLEFLWARAREVQA